MSYASEEYLYQQESEHNGSIVAQPSLMSEAQYDYILSLLDTCILADCQKDKIHESLDNTVTSDRANKIITELQQLQKNPLDRIREGELLLQTEVSQAIRKTLNDPNT